MSSRRGFSLVELMITVAVIGILTGISVPYLLVNLPNIRVNGAVRQIVGDFRLARTLAVERGVDCFLVFNAAGNSYEMSLDTDSTPGPSPGDEKIKTVSLAKDYPGIEFASSHTATPGVPVTFGSDTARFKPRGTAAAGTIYLSPAKDAGVRDDRDRMVTVIVSTGRARAFRWNPAATPPDWED